MLRREWAVRPADETFASLSALREAVKKRTEESFSIEEELSTIEFDNNDEADTVGFYSKDHGLVPLTNWAFHQLCRWIEKKPEHWKDAPSRLVAYDMSVWSEQKKKRWKRYQMGNHAIQGLTKPEYERLFYQDVLVSLQDALPGKWQVPQCDQGALSLSDRQMILFLHREQPIAEVAGTELLPGIYITCSEVDARPCAVVPGYSYGGVHWHTGLELVIQQPNDWSATLVKDELLPEALDHLETNKEQTTSLLEQACSKHIAAAEVESRLGQMIRPESAQDETIWSYVAAIIKSHSAMGYKEKQLRADGQVRQMLEKLLA